MQIPKHVLAAILLLGPSALASPLPGDNGVATVAERAELDAEFEKRAYGGAREEADRGRGRNSAATVLLPPVPSRRSDASSLQSYPRVRFHHLTMSERRTRRQAALAAAAEQDTPTPTPSKSIESPSMNGDTDGAASEADEAADTINDDPAAPVNENVFLFWPNVIGYVRIVLAIASLYYMPLHPRTCSLLYSISCLLDALDGYAARYFNQSTRFGAVLDMVTDRCTTSCLLVFLSSAFPRWAIIFQSLIALDFSSHYMHMYATLAMGGSAESHKNVDKSRSWMLNLYYTNKTVLFVCCAANELFFIALYLLSFSSPLLSPQLLSTVGDSKAAAIRSGAQVNGATLSQLFTNPYSAAALELARANKMDSFWPWVLAGVSAPIMAFKQYLNVVHLIKASKWLAEGDLAARQAARASNTEKKSRKSR